MTVDEVRVRTDPAAPSCYDYFIPQKGVGAFDRGRDRTSRAASRDFSVPGTVEVMSYYLLYTLAFLAIGLFAGHVSKDDLPGGALVGARAGYALGVAGALAGGLSWLALRGYGWGGIQGGTQAGQGPEARAYAHLAGDTTQPGYWIGLFMAAVGALLVLAAYRLFVFSEDAH